MTRSADKWDKNPRSYPCTRKFLDCSTTSLGHLGNTLSQVGPVHQSSGNLLTEFPRLPITAGFCLVETYFQAINSRSKILLTLFATNNLQRPLSFNHTSTTVLSVEQVTDITGYCYC